ncbi:tRNA uridine-5-carboxymethylaminomethyl(34) synthesis GTPase MnmE [Marinilabiliaceae bacterium ANBcel2]|nr:tRNA uridine-5-carboxymethylaminomethyl(34) synthesis GTPase MnmE [Marinilabiliaceae bacterium ANBcel2]
MITNDTICAISTAPGSAAIALIRITGSKAYDICNNIFLPANKKKELQKEPANSLIFGTIKDKESKRDIDEVILSLFRAPHSFTGEDIIEIACHGAPFIQNEIVNLLIKNGARLAQPGEFTQRAFINGKMDLSQAEAVADLIASQSESSRKVAFQQMKGGISSELLTLREKLLWFISMVELELDFSEEDVEFADRNELQNLVAEIKEHLDRLVNSFTLGNAIKHGIPVAIVGHTNAGKSTLLNTLLNEEKAIVSEIHGTTRDAIEDVINIEGVTFRFIDTAGIRETTDKIENLGIKLTYDKIKKAQIVLLLADVNDPDNKIQEAISQVSEKIDFKNQQLIVVINKSDLLTKEKIEKRFSTPAYKELKEKVSAIITVSAKYHNNINLLIEELLKTVNLNAINQNEVIVTNARHYEALSNALESIIRVEEGLENEISGDFLAQDIREVLHYLGSITGQISTDEILGNIFKNFCIGK